MKWWIYSYMYMFMNGTTAIELSCIHISLASWHLFVPSSVYYASGTSLAKFPDDGIIVTQTLKDQGKTTDSVPHFCLVFDLLLYFSYTCTLYHILGYIVTVWKLYIYWYLVFHILSSQIYTYFIFPELLVQCMTPCVTYHK